MYAKLLGSDQSIERGKDARFLAVHRNSQSVRVPKLFIKADKEAGLGTVHRIWQRGFELIRVPSKADQDSRVPREGTEFQA